jgi:hypothetical protein
MGSFSVRERQLGLGDTTWTWTKVEIPTPQVFYHVRQALLYIAMLFQCKLVILITTARSNIGLALGARRRREAKLTWLSAPQARSKIGVAGRAAGEKENWLGQGRAAGEKRNWLIDWARRRREAKLAWPGARRRRKAKLAY